jgi:apolipoprotein N-acyltransferase
MRSLRFQLPILAGFLIGTSYIPLPPWALFFCLSPLIIFWERLATDTEKSHTLRDAFVGGWITQFILNLIGFHWIAYTAIEFGHFPMWGGILSLMGFAAIAHLYYPLAGFLTVLLFRKMKIKKSFFIPIAVVVFAICEIVFPKIFPWHLGYPWLWAKFAGYQLADVIGFDGLDIFTLAINGMVAAAILSGLLQRKPERKALKIIVTAIALVAGINLLGLGREKQWEHPDSDLKVLAVQGNIGNFDKLMVEKGRAFRDPIISKFFELTTMGLKLFPETDLVLWSETAFPDMLDRGYQGAPNTVKLHDFVANAHVPLLTGAYSYEFRTKDMYNGFFYMNASGNIPLLPYRKSILLVFGETFPFSEYIPYMEKLFPDLGSFSRGGGPEIMNLDIDGKNGQKHVAIGPQICYEGLYPWFTASLARQNAQIFTNVTNDSWFGTYFEPYQHMYMTFARAIEYRRPLIRSTNTGITSAILASGEILQASPIDKEWVGLLDVKYNATPPHTFYENIAGRWIWILLVVLVFLIIGGRVKNERT